MRLNPNNPIQGERSQRLGFWSVRIFSPLTYLMIEHSESKDGRCFKIFRPGNLRNPVGHILKLGPDQYEGFVYSTGQGMITGSSPEIVCTKIGEIYEKTKF